MKRCLHGVRAFKISIPLRVGLSCLRRKPSREIQAEKLEINSKITWLFVGFDIYDLYTLYFSCDFNQHGFANSSTSHFLVVPQYILLSLHQPLDFLYGVHS